MPKSVSSEKSAGCDETNLKAGHSFTSRLPDECKEESAPVYTLDPNFPLPRYGQHLGDAQSDNTKQPSGSRPFSEDSKRSAYPSQPSPTESEQLTALLRETLDRFARAGERYDAFLSARNQTSAPSRTASPSDSGSLLSKLAQGPPLRTFDYPQLPLRTFDYSLEKLISFISEGRDKMAAAALRLKISPKKELLTCRQDLSSIIASSGPVSRAEYVEMVEEAITDERWRSDAKYAWDEERERSGKAD